MISSPLWFEQRCSQKLERETARKEEAATWLFIRMHYLLRIGVIKPVQLLKPVFENFQILNQKIKYTAIFMS